MIDIHCHILPGIDDGPETLEDSLAMARAAVASGITKTVATPHLRPDFPGVKIDEIADRVAALQSALEAEGIELELVPGGEVGLTWALEVDDATLRCASYGQAGHDILIETPNTGGVMLPGLLSQIASRGYRVILAHPERLGDLRNVPTLVDQLIERGVRLQVNADGFLMDPKKQPIGKAAREFLAAGLVTALASDAHRAAERRPVTVLREVAESLPEIAGLDRHTVLQLTQDAPAAILAGQPLSPVVRRERPKRRRTFPRL